ncbi:MAG: nucleotidyltransferase domain-containing protein [Chitinispirillia bacterium]|nr:nucleotidyltransferase domain-containing protein [Chitinispirillia bacterium]
MRISNHERNAIVKSVKDADETAKVWLFGSRADNTKKGGDIDIAILSDKINRIQKFYIRYAIEEKIGLQKIDIVVSKDLTDPFFADAISQGVRLDE